MFVSSRDVAIASAPSATDSSTVRSNCRLITTRSSLSPAMEDPFNQSKVTFSLSIRSITVVEKDRIKIICNWKWLAVDSLVIDAGERYDFVVNAGQTISSYWIRLHGLMDCIPKQVFQAAILRYNGAQETEPEEILTFENTNRTGRVWFNI